jgi:hypothetical protein
MKLTPANQALNALPDSQLSKLFPRVATREKKPALKGGPKQSRGTGDQHALRG